MQRKWLLPVLASLLLATNALWLYNFIDRAVTVSYQSDAIAGHRRDKLLLGEIAVALLSDCPQGEPEKRLSIFGSQHIIKESADVTFIDNVGLRFREGKLAAVVFASEPEVELSTH